MPIPPRTLTIGAAFASALWLYGVARECYCIRCWRPFALFTAAGHRHVCWRCRKVLRRGVAA